MRKGSSFKEAFPEVEIVRPARREAINPMSANDRLRYARATPRLPQSHSSHVAVSPLLEHFSVRTLNRSPFSSCSVSYQLAWAPDAL